MEKDFITPKQVPHYGPPTLKKRGQTDFHPKPEIEDCIRGVSFDYCYTGERMGPSGIIELHVTSVITDWQGHQYTRKARFMGHKATWKECIRGCISEHLLQLNVDSLMVRRMLREFEVRAEKYVDWERYGMVTYE